MYIYIMYRIDHLSIESYGDLGIPKLEKRAAHVRLERHPAKIQKVKSQKVYFSTFRLFEIHKDIFPLFDFSFFDFSKLSILSAWSLAAHLSPEHPFQEITFYHVAISLKKIAEKRLGLVGDPSLR